MSGFLIRVRHEAANDLFVTTGTWLSVRSSAGIIDDLDEAEWTAAAVRRMCPRSIVEIVPEEEA